jgi:hypothetical protein
VHEAAAQKRSDGASHLLHTGYKVEAKRVAHHGQADVDGEMQCKMHECKSAPNDEAEGRGKAEQHVGNEEHVPGDEGATAAGNGAAVAVQVAVAAEAIIADKRYHTTCLQLCTGPKAKEADGRVHDGHDALDDVVENLVDYTVGQTDHDRQETLQNEVEKARHKRDKVYRKHSAPNDKVEGHQDAGNKGRAPLDEGAAAANADEVHERRRERRSAPIDEAEGHGEAVQQVGNEGQGPANDGAAAASADTAVASHVNAAALAITTDGWGNTACLSLCNDPIADKAKATTTTKAKAHGLVPAREPSRHNPGKLHEALGEGDLQQRLGYRDNGGL